MPQRRTLQSKIPLVSDGNMENSEPHEKQWAESIWALKLKVGLSLNLLCLDLGFHDYSLLVWDPPFINFHLWATFGLILFSELVHLQTHFAWAKPHLLPFSTQCYLLDLGDKHHTKTMSIAT